MEADDFARKSNELGLRKLAAEHEADLRKALENGVVLTGKIPSDLHWSEEPSHTFTPRPCVEVKR